AHGPARRAHRRAARADAVRPVAVHTRPTADSTLFAAGSGVKNRSIKPRQWRFYGDAARSHGPQPPGEETPTKAEWRGSSPNSSRLRPWPLGDPRDFVP